MANTISDAGLEAIAQREGLVTDVYLDSGAAPTIGVGHLLTRAERASGKMLIGRDLVRYCEGLTIEQCHELLRQDVAVAANYVACVVKVSLAQHQFDALVSFVFNVGTEAFRNSTLLKRLNAWDYDGAAEQFARWIYDGGVRVPGLAARRESERRQFAGR